MDAPWWNGPDDRDDLTQDPALDICPDCGAGPDEPCDKTCGCVYCRKRELRERELLAGAIPAQKAG